MIVAIGMVVPTAAGTVLVMMVVMARAIGIVAFIVIMTCTFAVVVIMVAHALVVVAIMVMLASFGDTTAWNAKAFAWSVVVCTLVWTAFEVRAFMKTKMLYVDPDAKVPGHGDS